MMNYSKPMRINYKRLLTTWIISLIITSALTASITVLIIKDKAADATEAVFYTQKVQEPEQTATPTPAEPVVEEPMMELLGEYTITAYCPCEICCGEWAKNRPDGIVYGAAMVELQPGISIAAPKDFDFGTQIIIDGVEYVVQDRLANWVVERYEGKIIDIYFDDHQEALEFGKQVKEIFIIREERKVVQND